MTLRRHLPWLAIQALLVAALLTWPVLFQPANGVLGDPDSDTMKHLWTLWWFRQAVLVDGQFPFETLYVNFPVGIATWPIEPLNGLAALASPFSIETTVNLIAVGNLVLDGLVAGLLGWEVSGRRLGSHVAALLFQASSFAIFTLWVGVGELQHLWLLPLGAWCMLRALRTLQLRCAVTTGLVLGLGTLACFYYGWFLSLVLVVLGAVHLVRGPDRWRRLRQLVVAAALAAAVVVPGVRGFASSYGADEPARHGLVDWVFTEGLGQPVTDPASARLEPAHLVVGRAALWSRGLHDLEAYGGGRLLGVPVLLLAAVAIVRRPREAIPWVILALGGAALALGSFLTVGGAEVLVEGGRLRMPHLFLNRLLGYVAEPMNFPVRYLAVVHVALAALGALAVAQGGRVLGVVAGALALANVADVQARQLLPWPLPRFELPRFEGLAAVSDHEGHGILDLTAAWRDDKESRFVSMAAQLAHRHPIQGVPVDRLEYSHREGRRMAAALHLVEDLAPVYRGEQPGPPPGADYRPDFWMLGEWGFGEVLVTSLGGRQPLAPGIRHALDDVFGGPRTAGANYVLYALPQVVATPAEAETWRARFEARQEAAARVEARPGPGR